MTVNDLIQIIVGITAISTALFAGYHFMLKQIDEKIDGKIRSLKKANTNDTRILYVESGSIKLPPLVEDIEFKLDSSDGARPGFINKRNYISRVSFKRSFLESPDVMTCLTTLDVGTDGFFNTSYYINCRIGTQANKICENGFDLTTSTWDGTQVFKAEISWVAVGYINTFSYQDK